MEWDNQPIPNLYHIIAVLEGVNKYLDSDTLKNCIEYLYLLIKYLKEKEGKDDTL